MKKQIPHATHTHKLHRKCLCAIDRLRCPLWSSDEKYQRIVPGSQHETTQWDVTAPEGKTKWKTKMLTFCSFSGLGCRLLNLLLGSSTSRAPPKWRYEDQTALPRPVSVGHAFYSTFLLDSECGTGKELPSPQPSYVLSLLDSGQILGLLSWSISGMKGSLALTLPVFWK